MPRIETLRVLPGLWVAWQQNDYGARSHVRRGFTETHARDRVLVAEARHYARSLDHPGGAPT